MSEYVLLHDDPIEEGRLAMLSALLDPYMCFRLDLLGVDAGWSYLEVGAGNGSISRWLAGRVGTSGRVVCTDLETSFIDRLASEGISVRQLDIVLDPILQPVNGEGFDLIVARNVLHHLPEHNDVIERLAAALKPGGLLVTMEPDTATLWSTTSPEWLAYWQAFCAWSESRDIDYKLGCSLALRLSRVGLDRVESFSETSMLQGGRDTPTPVVTGFYRDTAIAIGPRMIADGFLSPS
ncbi:methyltransferase [Breoghania sp.]|uniref:class I SAM-dependent methyltransferase n=1 Tax=Breoghania sp. TaxID=2065378 RepID=UPI00263011A6|nr:methyltransferase [Breoghania sp.]MDJ0932850.1 methyltransferase [Breoghania sp.]